MKCHPDVIEAQEQIGSVPSRWNSKWNPHVASRFDHNTVARAPLTHKADANAFDNHTHNVIWVVYTAIV